jgi:hypothetical protein
VVCQLLFPDEAAATVTLVALERALPGVPTDVVVEIRQREVAFGTSLDCTVETIRPSVSGKVDVAIGALGERALA